MQESGKSLSEVYVGNIPTEMREDDLKKLFSSKFTVTNVKLKRNDKNKAYAFVKFSSAEEAEAVMEEYKNVTIGNRKLVLRRNVYPDPLKKLESPAKTRCQPEIIWKTDDDDDDDDYSDMPELGVIPEDILREIAAKLNLENGHPNLKPEICQLKLKLENGLPSRVEVEEEEEKTIDKKIIDKKPDDGNTKGSARNMGLEMSSRLCEPLSKIVILDFPAGTTEAELMGLFKKYCPIRCKMLVNTPNEITGEFTYAYIFLLNSEVAERAACQMNDTIFSGQKISVIHGVLGETR